MIERVGFACKWLDDPSETANMKINARNRELNTGTTTVAWLNRQTREVAEQRLWDLMPSLPLLTEPAALVWASVIDGISLNPYPPGPLQAITTWKLLPAAP